jgi:hypothetical protein
MATSRRFGLQERGAFLYDLASGNRLLPVGSTVTALTVTPNGRFAVAGIEEGTGRSTLHKANGLSYRPLSSSRVVSTKPADFPDKNRLTRNALVQPMA